MSYRGDVKLAQIVHFVAAPTGECRASIVTKVIEEGELKFLEVHLTVFTPDGQRLVKAKMDETRQLYGTWHHLGSCLK